jgi:CDP-diacylglycerol--glycerol-3-phosphate 3-phosphatidyltransferase
LDGYLARRLHQVTTLGKSLDPLVDKFLVILTLFAVCIMNPFIWLPALIILLRELAVSLIRDRAKRKGITIAAIQSGKVKMVMQSIAITLLLVPLSGVWQLITTVVMVVAVAMTLMSWYEYHLRYSACLERA